MLHAQCSVAFSPCSDDTHEYVAQDVFHLEFTFTLVVSCTFDRSPWTPQMLEGKQVKLVSMEVDAFLAKGSALKDVRGVGDEVGGTELGHDSCEGGSHRQEKEAWTDHTSNTLDQIDKKLMALQANKGGKDDKGGKGTGFQENCNCCGKYRHRLNEC